MALADVCVDEKWRSNVQNESEHRFTSYFILLNSQEQKFDDRFLLQIESLTTQGQYLRLVLSQIWQPALGRPKAGLHFGKSAFENSKNAFFQKIKMVYAKSALTMLFGMLFLL